MKLISLNVWEGEVYEPLKNFIKNHKNDTDIFCFQEVIRRKELNLFNEIQLLLPDFTGYLTEQVPGVGLATFIRNTINVSKLDSFSILSSRDIKGLIMPDGSGYYPRMMQVISIEKPKINICNFHGVPGNLKQDTKERELQTKRLQEILDSFDDPKIIVGDFNLNLDTEAILAMEKKVKNLIRESTFKTTRSKYYDKKEIMPFADYAFVSQNIKVKNFEVLQDEVSDHLPIMLEF